MCEYCEGEDLKELVKVRSKIEQTDIYVDFTSDGEPIPDCADHWWDSYQADGYEGEPPFRCCPNCGARIEVMRG